jgi:hypothetical protein
MPSAMLRLLWRGSVAQSQPRKSPMRFYGKRPQILRALLNIIRRTASSMERRSAERDSISQHRHYFQSGSIPVLSRCDVSPATATGDRSSPAAPASAQPCDRLSSASHQSNSHCGHAPRSRRGSTRSTAGSAHGECIPCFQRDSDSAAARRILPSWLSDSYSVSARAESRRFTSMQNQLDRSPRSSNN